MPDGNGPAGMDRLRRSDVFGSDSFPVGAAHFRLDQDVAAHCHDYLEVAVTFDGEGEHLRQGRAMTLRPGTVIGVRPGEWHGYARCSGLQVFNVYLGPELLGRHLGWTFDHPELARFLLRGGASGEHLSEAGLKAAVGWLTALAELRPVAGTPAAATALGLLGCLLGEIAACTFEPRSGGQTISPLVLEALRLLGENTSKPWQMPELARRLNVSVPHLHRKFTVELGISPMAWLARTRAEEAAALLMQTDQTVAGVGRQVGWPDANYFSRRFRSLLGMTPSEYRRRATG